MGPSSQENTQYGNLTSASGFATGTGEGDITASSDYMRSILSGDSSKISQALAPQIGNAKTSAQQQNKTTAEFGSRSGGTAATTASTNDKVHSDVTDLIGSLTKGAASTLGSEGSSLLSTGMEGTQAAFGDATGMQKQRASQVNDIFSSSAGVAASVLGAVPGNPGGWADIGSNAAAGMS